MLVFGRNDILQQYQEEFPILSVLIILCQWIFAGFSARNACWKMCGWIWSSGRPQIQALSNYL
jgi:hypothetical protein